ncbi:MAG: DUF3603 family protein [Bacilli bacterium]|jgi:hypothetical protein|nr:DUF3603 family protein [Bacilli bacterium]MCX4254536.1 DUF3603 family protein [Bacilli bacterium]
MNYYYDIILNWNENEAYEFYEWNDTDYLELIKKIPLIRIKHKIFLDLVSNKIKVSPEFLNMIQDKTLISGKNLINNITYAALLTDNKNVIAIEFDKEGNSISYSKLLIDDELNVLESTFNLKEYNLEYEILNKLPLNSNIRQENEAKKVISLEINNLYQKKDLSKLKYLYYEFKKEKSDDASYIYETLNQELNNNFSEDILKLYYIIKLSYHNV